MFFTRQFRRFIKVSVAYKSAVLVLLLRYAGKLPGFHYTYQVNHQQDPNLSSKGHADGSRIGVLKLFGLSLVKITLPSEAATSAYHFYLNRPYRDFRKALKIIETQFGIRYPQNNCQTVLEAGCGAGRYLQAFTDYYGGRAIGIDAYAPAISVANSAKLNPEDEFVVHDLTDLNYMDQILQRNIDTAIVSSFLIHYPIKDNIRKQFIKKLGDGIKLIVGVEKNDPALKDDLTENGFRVTTSGNYLYFARDNRVPDQ